MEPTDQKLLLLTNQVQKAIEKLEISREREEKAERYLESLKQKSGGHNARSYQGSSSCTNISMYSGAFKTMLPHHSACNTRTSIEACNSYTLGRVRHASTLHPILSFNESIGLFKERLENPHISIRDILEKTCRKKGVL